MYLVLVRHTKVKVEPNTCYGQKEVSLADGFELEFERIKNLLTQFEPYTLITSPSLRCKQLSSYLRQEDFLEDSRLLELNFGDWEGKKWEEIPQEEIEPWYNDFVNVKVPSGESFQELYNRVVDFFKNSSFTQNQVWVTHAGVIRSVICEVLGLDLRNAFRLEIDYGSASVLQRKHGNWILKQLGIF